MCRPLLIIEVSEPVIYLSYVQPLSYLVDMTLEEEISEPSMKDSRPVYMWENFLNSVIYCFESGKRFLLGLNSTN